MGTDMHLLVEIKIDDEPWRPVRGEVPRKCPRQYPLFAVLADVRNRAGRHDPRLVSPGTIATPDGDEVEIPPFLYDPEEGGHDRLTPISTPRGVPDDASFDWKVFCLAWEGLDGVLDTTWLTPREIVDGDWYQILYSTLNLSESEYAEYVAHGSIPKDTPMNVGGEGVLVVNEVEYASGKRGDNITYVSTRVSEGPVRNHSMGFVDFVKDLLDDLDDRTQVRFMFLFEA